MLRQINYTLKVELRQHIVWPLVSSLLVLFIAYIIFGIKNLSTETIAQISQRLLPNCLIFLLIPLFLPEQTEAVKSILKLKPFGLIYLLAIRLLVRLCLGSAILAAYFMLLGRSNGATDWHHWMQAVLLGLVYAGFGLICYAVMQHLVFGYLGAVMLSLIQWFSRPGWPAVLRPATWFDTAWQMAGVFSIGFSLIMGAILFWYRNNRAFD